jgi:tetratricopeptide (TPR) repeat protein
MVFINTNISDIIDSLPRNNVIWLILAIATLIGGFGNVFDKWQQRNNVPVIPEPPKEMYPPSPVIPNNLPPRGIFIGREAEKEELYQAIQSNLRLIVVEGVAGIGKTSLAIEVAYKFLDESLAARGKRGSQHDEFNVFIWITAKNSPVTLEKVLDIIARTLDYPYISQLKLEDKLEAVLRLLRKNRILLTIDNFETISDEKVLQFVKDMPEPCKVLVTTRGQRVWDTQYVPLILEKMQQTEGLNLIADEVKRLGLKLNQVDKDVVVDLYEATGGSPLAIKWAIGKIKQHGQSLTSIVEALRGAHGDIFKFLFADSWILLTDVSKEILFSMPIFAATVSRGALKATVGRQSIEFDEALGQLVELWLVESNRELIEEKQRFGIHSLTRAFVVGKASGLEDEKMLRASRYYLEFCNKRHLQIGMKGYDEIEAEVSNILGFLKWLDGRCCAKPKHDACQILVSFSEAINVFLWSRGYWGERVFLCERALHASKALEDWSSAARQAYYIGIVRFWQGEIEEADKRAEESKKLLNMLHKGHTINYIDMALTKRLLSLVMMGKGKYKEATDLHNSILEGISQLGAAKGEEIRIFADWICPGPEGYKVGFVSLKQELGIIDNAKGDHFSALKWLDESKILAQKIGDSEGLSVSLSHLGHALLGLHMIKEAKKMYLDGLKMATQVQRKSTMGRCNQGLADVAFIEGRLEDASRYGQEAMNLFERLGMKREMESVMNLLERIKEIWNHEELKW